MKRLVFEDLVGLSDPEKMVLYLTQNRNETADAIPLVKAQGFDASHMEQHLRAVEKQLSEATALLPKPEAGA